MVKSHLVFKNGFLNGYIRLAATSYTPNEIVYDLPGLIINANVTVGDQEDNFHVIGSNGMLESYRFAIDFYGRITFMNSSKTSADTIVIPINLHVKSIETAWLEELI